MKKAAYHLEIDDRRSSSSSPSPSSRGSVSISRRQLLAGADAAAALLFERSFNEDFGFPNSARVHHWR